MPSIKTDLGSLFWTHQSPWSRPTYGFAAQPITGLGIMQTESSWAWFIRTAFPSHALAASSAKYVWALDCQRSFLPIRTDLVGGSCRVCQHSVLVNIALLTAHLCIFCDILRALQTTGQAQIILTAQEFNLSIQKNVLWVGNGLICQGKEPVLFVAMEKTKGMSCFQ